MDFIVAIDCNVMCYFVIDHHVNCKVTFNQNINQRDVCTNLPLDTFSINSPPPINIIVLGPMSSLWDVTQCDRY